MKTKGKLNIPFEIHSGKTSYLGRYWLTQYVQRPGAPSFNGRSASAEVRDQLLSDRTLALPNLPTLYEATSSYLSNENTAEAMQRITQINKITDRNASVIRTERPTDGKEHNGCTWWC